MSRRKRGIGGRPSVMTPRTRKRLTDAIRAGNYYEAACSYAGISYSTFRLWMKKGEQGEEEEYIEFFNEIQAAESEAEARVVANWQKQIPSNWQAARDFLERRFPDRWGKQKIDIAHSGAIANSAPTAKEDEIVNAIHENPKATIAMAELVQQLSEGKAPDDIKKVIENKDITEKKDAGNQ